MERIHGLPKRGYVDADTNFSGAASEAVRQFDADYKANAEAEPQGAS
jgi:hypothetical protein